MSTCTADRPKKTQPRLNIFSWDDLLDKYTKTGNDRALKEAIHLEMRRRIKLGWQGNERYAPLRLFHH
jgi:hypothetical protein